MRNRVLFGLGLLLLLTLPSALIAESPPKQTILTRSVNVNSKDKKKIAYLKGTYRALLIGNNDYHFKDQWSTLNTPINDIQELADLLSDRYQFDRQHIAMIKNGTRAQILKAFNQLADKSEPNDSVLVYYAGHGHFDKNKKGYWVPVDGNNEFDYISNEDILSKLSTVKVKHKLLISDSCFSGNLMLTTRSRQRTDQIKSGSSYFRKYNELSSVHGLSSGGNQPVSDSGEQWGGHSIFAYHLLAILKVNRERFFSATDLIADL